MQKENFYTREKLVRKKVTTKKVHKIYLLIAVLGGLLISVAMPLFNEPDGQYHFAVSSAMVGLNTDISKYGEKDIASGMEGQKDFYRKGTFVEQYLLTKATLYPIKDSPRDLGLDNKFSYNYIGHIIPAVGIWLGYHLYPSMGMMIIVARIFSMLFYSLIMYFIIRHLKFGQLLFATVSLSPVIMNTFSSLSYDALGMVTVAGSVALMINMIAMKRVKLSDVLLMFLLLVLSLLGCKPNLWVVNILFPITGIITAIMPRQIQQESLYTRRNKEKANILIKHKWLFLIGLILIFVLVGSYLTRDRGGLLEVLTRLVFTQSFRFYPVSSPGDFVNLLVSPYPTYNYMPTILIAIWGILVLVALLSDESYHKSILLSWATSLVIALGIFATYYGFLGYGMLQGFALRMTIQGVQWRYFTPLLLLLPLVFSNQKFKTKVVNRNAVLIFMAITAIVSNFLLVFNTLWGMIMV